MNRGFTLIELLVAIAVMLILSAGVVSLFLNINTRSQEELQRNELVDRANRISSYLVWEIREAGFGVSSVPKLADGSNLTINSVGYSYSIVPSYNPNGNDSIAIIKAISFLPKLRVNQNTPAGNTTVGLDRAPKNYEIDPADDYKSYVVFESHKKVYRVISVNNNTMTLSSALVENVPAQTEVLGLRVINFYLSNGELHRDDGITNSIVDEAVDGFKLNYVLIDGTETPNPSNPSDIRAVKFYVLLRTLRPSKSYTDNKTYQLGSITLGPYNDGYRRLLVENSVEVKNVGY